MIRFKKEVLKAELRYNGIQRTDFIGYFTERWVADNAIRQEQARIDIYGNNTTPYIAKDIIDIEIYETHGDYTNRGQEQIADAVIAALSPEQFAAIKARILREREESIPKG